ncbi:MAG: hypothetical protein AAF632_03610 [Bacteroidota bacterium]
MSTSVSDKHILVDPTVVEGKPRIQVHCITVQDIVIWHERMEKSVDEISTVRYWRRNFPNVVILSVV